MIHTIGQVMLYVGDVELVGKFFVEKLGFNLIKDDTSTPVRQFEVSPNDRETSFVIMNKDIVKTFSPELDFATPSIMFYATNLDQLYADFKVKGITVGDLVVMPFGKVFNFADPEGHYFAILEK